MYISHTFRFTKIVGDEDGISSVTILNSEEKVTDIIPVELEDCVIQLKNILKVLENNST